MKKIINKRNGIIAAVVTIVVIAAIIATTSISSGMALKEAKDLAKKQVPSTAKFVSSEDDDNKYEIKFYDDVNKESFEVEVYKDSKKVKSVECQLDNDLGSKNVKLSESDVKQIISKNFEGASVTSVVLTKDNGVYEYEASFKTNNFYGNADVNPETGVILESTVKFGTATVIPNDEKQSGDDNKNDSSNNSSSAVDNSNANNSSVANNSSPSNNSSVANESSPSNNSSVANESSPAADSGNDSSANTNNSSNTTPSIISESKARSIVLGKLPGSTINSIYLDSDDGKKVYEGKATLKGYEYEFEINASSGVITEWSKELIETDHHSEHDDDDDDHDNDHDNDDYDHNNGYDD